MLNVAEIRYEVVKIKRIVIEIYNRVVVLDPIVDTEIPTIHLSTFG